MVRVCVCVCVCVCACACVCVCVCVFSVLFDEVKFCILKSGTRNTNRFILIFIH